MYAPRGRELERGVMLIIVPTLDNEEFINLRGI